MKRTTLAIEERLLRLLKKRAAEEGSSLQALANDLLRRGLVQPARRDYQVRLQGWEAQEQPGVDLLDRDQLFDLMDGR